MERRKFLLWMAALQAVATGALAGDDDSGDDSGRGRGRGRGGDDDKDDDNDNSGPGNGDDDDNDDNDNDNDDDDGGKDDDGGDGGTRTDGGQGTGKSASQGERGLPAVDADTVVLRYADGSAERVRNGRYQRVDSTGRVVESRAATGSDITRISAARLGRGTEMIIRIDSRRGEIETVDRRGWREVLAHGTYLLTDPNGNVVRRRAARPSDIGRIRKLAGG